MNVDPVSFYGRQAVAGGELRPDVVPAAPAVEPELNLMEYVNLIWVRRWVVVAVLVTTVVVGFAWSSTRTKLYMAVTEISVTERNPQIIKNQINMGPNYWEMERYADEQLRVLRTRRVAQRVVDRLGLASHPEFAGGNPAAALAARIRAERDEASNIISVSLMASQPGDAAEWLNLYIQEYIAINIEDNLERTRKVYDVIQSRLDPLREQLERSETVLMEFREREDALLFADQDKNVISEQVNTLTSEYAAAKAERIRLETKLNALDRLASGSTSETSFPEVLQDATIQSLRGQRTTLEMDLNDKLRSLKDGHPVIKDLRSRISELEAKETEQIATIRAALETDYDIVRQRERSLFANIQQLKVESIELSKQSMEYERLRREYEQNKAFLEEMLARSKEVDISATASGNTARVIEPALVPGAPYTPNVRRAVLVSIGLGLLLGIGLVVGLDYLDHTLRTPEQVERHLGLEVLSILPRSTGNGSEATVRESFQSLRTALLLASRSEGCHVQMVTSAVPGEGKTTAVLELGKILAAGGSRVLLIDADLRRPRLHRAVGVENDVGLTSVVLGERAATDVLVPYSGVPNLEVLTSGPLPPNPPELFGKASFSKLLDWARREYDWVIIDTPPVASVTDPVICSRLVDMALLVVQYGGPRRQVVRDAVRQLGRSGVRMAGVLFNKVDMERDHYYYYYSNYTYYRYGYADEQAAPTSPAHAGREGASSGSDGAVEAEQGEPGGIADALAPPATGVRAVDPGAETKPRLSKRRHRATRPARQHDA